MQENLLAIDVGSKELVTKIKRFNNHCTQRTFPNTITGRQQLIEWATKDKVPVRACLEATGAYSWEIALALYHTPECQVMMGNPRATKQFASALMKRAKTDKVDTDSLLEYLGRMPFNQWRPPAQEVLELQAITRRIIQLKDLITQEKNRLHAATQMPSIKHIILDDIETSISSLQVRIEQLEQKGKCLLKSNSLEHDWKLLVSITGVADLSAMYILAEILTLPADMQVQQWVAYAGLDPRAFESGTSINKPRRISKAGNKYLRAALYMPALVAIRYQPNIKQFYEKLVAAGKKKMQALVAVMRKLLHCIWGMLKHNQPFDGEKFCKLNCK